jgi:branched-chain amino acid transport system substrate-binding protein
MDRMKLSGGLLGIVVLIVVSLLLPSPAMAQQKKADAKIIKIGILAALTGFASAAEVHQKDGALLAIDWLNEKGGITIKGQKYLFEGVVEDNKSTAEGAKAAAEKLVYDHKVKFIAGATIPYINIAAAPVTEAAKVIRALNYVCDTPEELNAKTRYTFKPNPAIREGIGPALDYLVEKFPKVKTIAMITPQDGAESVLGAICDKEATQRGLKQVIVVAWPHDTADFYPKVTQLLASKPDAIFIVNGYEQATAPILKAAREMGFKGPAPMGNYDDPYDIVKLTGKDYTAPFWTHGWSRDVNDPQLTPEMKEIIKRAEAKLGKFHQWNFWGWTEVWAIAQAIEKAQSLDTTVVANTWRKMDSIKTPYGPGKMCGEKTYGIKNVVCSRVAITEVLPDGNVKHIKWVNVNLP